MWYYIDNDFIGAYSSADMTGNTGWIYCSDIIAEPLEDDEGEQLYMLVDGHIIRRP